MARHSSRLLDLAKRGAEARLQNLIDEAKLLVELFPHLRDSFDADELPVSFILAKGARRGKRPNPKGRRRQMSAAARKAVGARMKRYWAARRKAKGR
jgi:hypothetical protein